MGSSVWDWGESKSDIFFKSKLISVTLSLLFPQSCRCQCNLVPETPVTGSSGWVSIPTSQIICLFPESVGSLWVLQRWAILLWGVGQQRAPAGEPFLFHSLYGLLLSTFWLTQELHWSSQALSLAALGSEVVHKSTAETRWAAGTGIRPETGRTQREQWLHCTFQN